VDGVTPCQELSAKYLCTVAFGVPEPNISEPVKLADVDSITSPAFTVFVTAPVSVNFASLSILSVEPLAIWSEAHSRKVVPLIIG